MVWDISHEIFAIQGLSLRWYSLLFALGIVIGYFFMVSVFRKDGKDPALVDRLLLMVVLGTVIGARLGHCLLYEPGIYLQDPLRILKVWEGGLASHGGFTGVLVALWLFVRLTPSIEFLWLADRMCIPAMFAATCIRVGNLFNSEIIGRPTDVPWAFVFKRVDEIPRHPTQIYEALGYLALGLILLVLHHRRGERLRHGAVLGGTFIGAFGFRFLIERFKEVQVDFEKNLWLDMGQLLSVPFMAVGLVLIFGWHKSARWQRLFNRQPAAPHGNVAERLAKPAVAAAGSSKRRRQRRRSA